MMGTGDPTAVAGFYTLLGTVAVAFFGFLGLVLKAMIDARQGQASKRDDAASKTAAVLADYQTKLQQSQADNFALRQQALTEQAAADRRFNDEHRARMDVEVDYERLEQKHNGCEENVRNIREILKANLPDNGTTIIAICVRQGLMPPEKGTN